MEQCASSSSTQHITVGVLLKRKIIVRSPRPRRRAQDGSANDPPPKCCMSATLGARHCDPTLSGGVRRYLSDFYDPDYGDEHNLLDAICLFIDQVYEAMIRVLILINVQWQTWF